MSGIRSSLMIKLSTELLLPAWPFSTWLGLVHNNLHRLLSLVALSLLLCPYQPHCQMGPLQTVTKVVTVVGTVLYVSSFPLKMHQLPLFYPVVISTVTLAAFGGSSRSAMPIVEWLARLQEPNLPEKAVQYTRCVTQAWCLFFIFNGSTVSFTTLYGNTSLWTARNGIIAYLLTGFLIAGEWLIHYQMTKREVS